MTLRSPRALAIAAVISSIAFPALAAPANDDPVVANVNGKEIRRSALLEAQAGIPQARQLPFDKIYDQLLEQVITNELIIDQAKKQKLEDDADVKAAYKAAQQQILARAWVAKAGRKFESEISDAQVKAHYDELAKEGKIPEQVHAHHILVASEDAAKAVMNDLKTVPFADEAKAKSTDPSAKQNAGDLGYITAGTTVAEFSEAAFKLKNGEMTAAPVKTQFGWHVIKVDDRRAMPLDDIKNDVKSDLVQGEIGKSLDAMKKSAAIKRFKADGTAADVAAKSAAPDNKAKN